MGGSVPLRRPAHAMEGWMSRRVPSQPRQRLLLGLGFLAVAAVGILGDASVGEPFAWSLLGAGAVTVVIGGVGELRHRKGRSEGRIAP